MGLVFDIQRFSVHDGPGIRTTFFLKGCPLRCAWCHNPEGLEPHVQLQFCKESCIDCGNCAAACRNGVHSLLDIGHTVDFSKCTQCGRCVESCPSGALKLMGKELTPQEVLKTALRDRPFYSKTGGVTFSGGEATMQPDFLFSALSLCHEAGLSTAVDTSGLTSKETLLKLMDVCDLFLYDIKAVTGQIHQEGTGKDNAVILENFCTLMENGARVWVRVPVIGGFNAFEEEIGKIALFLKEHPGAEQIELMPYHKLGSGKYAEIGRTIPDNAQRPVSHAQMESYYEIFKQYGLPVQGGRKEKKQ